QHDAADHPQLLEGVEGAVDGRPVDVGVVDLHPGNQLVGGDVVVGGGDQRPDDRPAASGDAAPVGSEVLDDRLDRRLDVVDRRLPLAGSGHVTSFHRNRALLHTGSKCDFITLVFASCTSPTGSSTAPPRRWPAPSRWAPSPWPPGAAVTS